MTVFYIAADVIIGLYFVWLSGFGGPGEWLYVGGLNGVFLSPCFLLLGALSHIIPQQCPGYNEDDDTTEGDAQNSIWNKT